MLIAADGMLASNKTQEARMNFFRRKNRAYQSLNNALSRDGGKVSDALLGGIIMATITESRLSDSAACNAHLQGYEAAIRARGGLRNSLLVCSTPALTIAHLMPYLVCDPDLPLMEAESSVLQQVQTFVEFLTAEMRPLGFSKPISAGDDERGLVQLETMSLIESVLSRRTVMFYLRPVEAGVQGYIDESSNVLSLYLIALTLWRARESGSSAEIFLDRLASVLRQSSTVDSVTGDPRLTEHGFMWVTLKAVQDFHARLSDYKHNTIQTTLDAVNVLVAFRKIASRDARNQARYLLFHMLQGEVVQA
jgi:hypothetical protein